MRIVLLTENPILAIGLESALRQAGHTLLLCSSVAQLREQTAPGHPFYLRLNQLLEQEKFDQFAEGECATSIRKRTAARR